MVGWFLLGQDMIIESIGALSFAHLSERRKLSARHGRSLTFYSLYTCPFPPALPLYHLVLAPNWSLLLDCWQLSAALSHSATCSVFFVGQNFLSMILHTKQQGETRSGVLESFICNSPESKRIGKYMSTLGEKVAHYCEAQIKW